MQAVIDRERDKETIANKIRNEGMKEERSSK